MRNIILKLLPLTLLMFLFVSCNNASNNKNLSLIKSNSSIIDNQDFFSDKSEEELVGNIYMFNQNSKQYIVFYQMNINPDSVEISVIDDIIQINLTKDENYKDIYVYEIPNYLDYKRYTLKIMNGTEELTIKSVIL
ncbi:hypothetical protein [Clostridium perfringens]|uniref:hypothetical protein n=1 Tax=Clostridium perfringens TaxID=1502 RepID=UPI001A32624A|nr:hypothetical protein [Clostridium perfringens]